MLLRWRKALTRTVARLKPRKSERNTRGTRLHYVACKAAAMAAVLVAFICQVHGHRCDSHANSCECCFCLLVCTEALLMVSCVWFLRYGARVSYHKVYSCVIWCHCRRSSQHLCCAYQACWLMEILFCSKCLAVSHFVLSISQSSVALYALPQPHLALAGHWQDVRV